MLNFHHVVAGFPDHITIVFGIKKANLQSSHSKKWL